MKYFTLFFLLIPMLIFGQTAPQKGMPKLGPNPLFFVDSVKTQRSDLQNINPKAIAAVTVLTEKSATGIYGTAGTDGVVLITTKTFARKKYTNLFRQVSVQYDSLYTKQGNDSTFQYILNGEVQKGNFEGRLLSIDKKSLLQINVLSNAQLKNKFGITDKQYGILIETKKIANLQ